MSPDDAYLIYEFLEKQFDDFKDHIEQYGCDRSEAADIIDRLKEITEIE